ncbi:uncharacterized protein [Clytia hemisphaerica]|uniref:TIR domain-containing protein n=1 Tax=Clytia hemisphaerica TaxID=252671 RepID=A0A7M5U836_9CNID
MEGVVEQLNALLAPKFGYGLLTDASFSENTVEAFGKLVSILQGAENVAAEKAAQLAKDNTPKTGDTAFVYWHGHGWFTAKIESWLPEELNYMIRWTEGNWAPERAKYNNLCVDKIPDPSIIGVGSKVLFKQGLYYAGNNDDGSVCDSSGRSLSEEKKQELQAKNQISDRWHMGVIKNVSTNSEGVTVYNGEHIEPQDPQCTRGNFVDYSPAFSGLTIEELRTLPNIFNCLDTGDDNGETSSCDVFLSKVNQDDANILKILKQIKTIYNVSESKGGNSSSKGLQQTVGKIKNCKVYLVALTDAFIANEQAMSELLYAKKTLGKTVIPLVLGTSHKWTQTTAGMLLAGQLYIQFANDDVYDEKLTELQKNLEKLVVCDPKAKKTRSGGDSDPPRVFLSYCWANSKLSHEAEQVRSFTGHTFSDPRKIKADIEKEIGERVWLDIEQLDSVDDSGMFGQIAQGLAESTVVVMCVSAEYSRSQNCQMEANFALRSLHKKAIVLEVGTGEDSDRAAWKQSSVGMVLPTDQEPLIMTADHITGEASYQATITKICQQIREVVPEDGTRVLPQHEPETEAEIANKESLRASVPMYGDSVIAHYAQWQFFPAKVVNFDKSVLKYTVDWDDPDPACRVQRYDLVAVNRAPTENAIGLGTSILFKQGTYQHNGGTGDVWNLGEITNIEVLDDGSKLYSGKHSKTAADNLAVAGWSSFRPTFEKHKIEDLRLFPNAIEMLQAYQKL